MAHTVEEGKDEIASLQARLTSSDSHGDQLFQVQKDLNDKDRKIQVLHMKCVMHTIHTV